MFGGSIRVVVFFLSLFFLTFAMVVKADVKLELNEAEKRWLVAHPSVKFTGDPNWLPYEAFDGDGKYIGIVAEHLRLIEKSTGLKFKMSPSNTWTESTEKAKQGVVDVLSETDDSDLKSHLNFTNPYITNPIIVVMHSRENYVEGIANIKDRKIALIKDYGYTAKIRRNYAYIDFVTVNDIQNGLIAVSAGKVDALLCTLALCSYTIAELGLNNVKITGKTEFDTKLALGVQKDLPELLSILNKGISGISRGEQQKILDSWVKGNFIEKTDYTLVLQIIFAAITLLGLFIFWNRRLSREVALRIRTEEELKAAQKVLQISNQRLLSHRENTPLGVIEWNTNFEIVDWNQAAENIFGFSKAEVIGQHIRDNILPDSMLTDSMRETIGRIWSDLIHGRGGKRSTNKHITKDGRIILCEWYNASLYDQNGKVIGVASLVEDNTERKKVEKEIEKYRDHLEELVEARTTDLAAARDEAERANIAKSEFLSRMSHELRTPMNAILGFSQILEMRAKGLDETERNHVKEIIEAGHHLLNLINELLDLAQIESGKLDFDIEEVSIDKLLQQCVKLVATQAELRDVKITDNVSNDGYIVQADSTRLKQVLLNLLSNAVKYNHEHGHIILDSKVTDPHYLRISVIDSGIGLSQVGIAKLFTPFERLGLGNKIEGIGIGLVITKHLVEIMGGKIGVTSKQGEGSTFWIELPLSNGE